MRTVARSDQEPAIMAILDKVRELQAEAGLCDVIIPEHSLAYNPQSNGVVERGVQEIEGALRAGYLSLQERLGRRLDARERIVAFLPEYVAYLLNRLKEGKDGKTVYERIRGKKASVVGLEFGERVLYKILLYHPNQN